MKKLEAQINNQDYISDAVNKKEGKICNHGISINISRKCNWRTEKYDQNGVNYKCTGYKLLMQPGKTIR